ncbi:hypothetical protein FN846DRAFT_888480 [Sphaerosporella brunnea]|uniref:Uncharacterized protein n=1 Tax=Sphaerosporella brunnea TaxID=1250544 RepID=A0A5J5F321_9PEZI|nr:hypothetical protein FN846DRAFT_888480 [Sphaerosporella brunnea]
MAAGTQETSEEPNDGHEDEPMISDEHQHTACVPSGVNPDDVHGNLEPPSVSSHACPQPNIDLQNFQFTFESPYGKWKQACTNNAQSSGVSAAIFPKLATATVATTQESEEDPNVVDKDDPTASEDRHQSSPIPRETYAASVKSNSERSSVNWHALPQPHIDLQNYEFTFRTPLVYPLQRDTNSMQKTDDSAFASLDVCHGMKHVTNEKTPHVPTITTTDHPPNRTHRSPSVTSFQMMPKTNTEAATETSTLFASGKQRARTFGVSNHTYVDPDRDDGVDTGLSAAPMSVQRHDCTGGSQNKGFKENLNTPHYPSVQGYAHPESTQNVASSDHSDDLNGQIGDPEDTEDARNIDAQAGAQRTVDMWGSNGTSNKRNRTSNSVSETTTQHWPQHVRRNLFLDTMQFPIRQAQDDRWIKDIRRPLTLVDKIIAESKRFTVREGQARARMRIPTQQASDKPEAQNGRGVKRAAGGMADAGTSPKRREVRKPIPGNADSFNRLPPQPRHWPSLQEVLEEERDRRLLVARKRAADVENDLGKTNAAVQNGPERNGEMPEHSRFLKRARITRAGPATHTNPGARPQLPPPVSRHGRHHAARGQQANGDTINSQFTGFWVWAVALAWRAVSDVIRS